MQTFSHLRRSRFNLQPLLTLLLFAAALVYESIGTIYPFLTPMLGVGFYYWRCHHAKKEHYFHIFLFFAYTLWFEIDRDMLLFSFIILAILYDTFLAKYIETSFSCPFCLRLFYVAYTYGGYYLLNLFLAFLFNMPLPDFNMLYWIYMATDLCLLVLLT